MSEWLYRHRILIFLSTLPIKGEESKFLNIWNNFFSLLNHSYSHSHTWVQLHVQSQANTHPAHLQWAERVREKVITSSCSHCSHGYLYITGVLGRRVILPPGHLWHALWNKHTQRKSERTAVRGADKSGAHRCWWWWPDSDSTAVSPLHVDSEGGVI